MSKEKKRTFLRVGSVVGIVAIGFLAMTFLGSADKKSNKRDVEPEVRTVEVQNVEFKNLTLRIEGNGVVESQRTLNIVSEAKGQVEFAKNNLKNGTYAEKGELILKVDSREVENNLYSLRSDFMNTVAGIIPEMKIEDESIYDKWYDYFLSLDINKTVPELPEIETTQEKIKASSRNIFTKYYAVKNQEILVSKYEIYAPFDGFIKSNGIIENSFVNVGQQLFTIDDVSNLEIAVPLLVDEYNLINDNGTPRVRIYPDEKDDIYLTGRVIRKDTKLERNSQTLNVYVAFTNNSLNSYFLPGNYVHVQIDGDHMKGVAEIPRYTIDNESRIYTMEEGKLNQVPVDVIAYQGDEAVIKQTIPNETKLVTTILQKPLVGMQIQTVEQALAKEESNDTSGSGAEGVAAAK